METMLAYLSIRIVKHAKTGTLYQLVLVPLKNYKLEASGEPYYQYIDKTTQRFWVQSKSEKQGGRFILEQDRFLVKGTTDG